MALAGLSAEVANWYRLSRIIVNMVAGPSPLRRVRASAADDVLRMKQIFRRAADANVQRETDADEDAKMSAAKFYIPTLPGLPKDSTLTMYGGHIPTYKLSDPEAQKTSPHIFFYMLKSRHIADNQKTVFWFNGGPGCSSFDGALMEVGPLRVVPGEEVTLQEVEGGWNEYANLVFIDQPAGTGYSYVATDGYVHELTQMSKSFVEFLRNFYNVFPELESQETFLAGESYAGQYIPYIADELLNTKLVTPPLKGLLIGNGWIDPVSQYPAYYDFALEAGIIKAGSDVDTELKKMVEKCVTSMAKDSGKGLKVNYGYCEGILSAITQSTIQSINGQKMCVNNYDVRLTDTFPACGMNWPTDLSTITPYLQRNDVKSSFHAERMEGDWTECNGNVGANMWNIDSSASILLFPKLLEKTNILLFAGDQDLICNHVGIERLISNLTWKGASGLGSAATQDWIVDSKPAGTWSTARNLTYAKIFDASHMVPYDQPIVAHDMFLRFSDINVLDAAGPSAVIPSKIGDETEAILGQTQPNGSTVGIPVVTADGSEVVLSDGDGNRLNSLVNASSAIVIIIVMLFAFLIAYAVRRKMKTGLVPLAQHKRHRSGARHARRHDGLASDGDDPHELDELVRNEGREYDEERAEVKKDAELFGIGSDEEE